MDSIAAYPSVNAIRAKPVVVVNTCIKSAVNKVVRRVRVKQIRIHAGIRFNFGWPDVTISNIDRRRQQISDVAARYRNLVALSTGTAQIVPNDGVDNFDIAFIGAVQASTKRKQSHNFVISYRTIRDGSVHLPIS